MPKKPPPLATLTDPQIDQLARLLCGTQQNVYELAKSRFSSAADDSTFDRLRSVGKVFKCEECGFWLSVSTEDRVIKDVCMPCTDVMDE